MSDQNNTENTVISPENTVKLNKLIGSIITNAELISQGKYTIPSTSETRVSKIKKLGFQALDIVSDKNK
jgi:hypothetical protein